MAEALVRMQGADGTLVSPAIFIPLAEQHGLIAEISSIVLQNVSRLLAATAPEQLNVVSVNLSMQQFMSPSLIAELQALVEQYHFAPERMKLELTERVLSEDLPRMHRIMDELQQIGFGFSLDDFGTGYSCLQHLKCCPITTLKIDQSFVPRLPDDARDQTMVRAVIQLAHGLGMDVIFRRRLHQLIGRNGCCAASS